MTTRWEVEKAVKASSIDITGRCILMMLLSESNAGTAEIAPNHAPTFTELERITGASRSTLVEWMRALSGAGWVSRMVVEGESRTGFALSVGDPDAARAPRVRAAQGAGEASTDASQATMKGDAPCRQAIRHAEGVMPLGDTGHAARRYAGMPPGDTPDGSLLIRNSPTESSTTNPTLNPPLFAETGALALPKSRDAKPKKAEPHREDVERICEYLAEAVVANGSKRPTITDKWRTEARLLLDEQRSPKATVEKVTALIDWIKGSDWWAAKVLSMPKLRAKYDEIRLDALRDFNRNKTSGGYSNGFGYVAQRVNNDKPGSHTDAWNRRRAAHAQQ